MILQNDLYATLQYLNIAGISNTHTIINLINGTFPMFNTIVLGRIDSN